jgi:hypothetical protein
VDGSDDCVRGYVNARALRARRSGFAKDRLRALALVALQNDGGGWGGEGLLAEVFEEGGGEVALAGAGDDDDDEFLWAGGGPWRGPRRW